MNTIVRCVAVAALISGTSLFSQDEDDLALVDDEATTADEAVPPADGEDEVIDIGGGMRRSSSDKNKFFYTLPECQRLEGTAEVLKPGARDWEPIAEGDHYPLGSAFRAVGKETRLTIAFGHECKVVIIGEASFGTRNQPLGEPTRAISLRSGVITVQLPMNLPDGQFSVSAPGFTAVNMAGNSRYRYAKTGDGDEAIVRCVTGTMSIEGRHFKIGEMHAANEVKIRTSQDALFTGIYGTRGDYMVKLEQGQIKIRDPETGEGRIEEKFLDWKMSPQTAVRIHRAVPMLGQNMAVTIMTFEANGELKNRCAFTEHRFEVNSGELAPVSKAKQEELSKKAAEAADTVAVETEATETEAADDSSSESGDSDAADDEDLNF